jgi:hypothetical protein
MQNQHTKREWLRLANDRERRNQKHSIHTMLESELRTIRHRLQVLEDLIRRESLEFEDAEMSIVTELRVA